jgi:hypothetical protein
MKIKFFIILLFIQFQVWGQTEVKNWALGGYLKDMQSFVLLPKSDMMPSSQGLFDNLIHNRLNFAWYPNENFTFKSDLRTRFFWGDQIRLQPDNYIDLLNEANDFFELSYGISDSMGVAAHTMIDRFYLDYTTGNWQFRAGRQRINWGINTAWNPNDIFNAYSFTDFDYEEKPGSDAISAKYYINYASSIEIAVKAFDNIEKTTAGMLLKWNRWNYDFQILTGLMDWNLVVGGGWAGNLFDAGFKGEIAYFSPLGEQQEDGLAITLGIDYIFKNSLYANLGFLYNKNGNNDQSLSNIFSFDLSAKNLYPYKTAFFGSVNYPFSPLINGGIALIYSPVKTHPLFVSPNLSYSLGNNLDFGFFGQLILEKNEKFGSPVQAFFIRLKYSF